MILEEIQIDNFGIFQDFQFKLEPGFTLLERPNEFGKTTLLEFVRRMLYGFPDRRSRGNFYETSRRPYGGRLIFRSADGGRFTLERTGTGNGGEVRVFAPDGSEKKGAEALAPHLACPEAFYKSVYAVTVDELRSASVLDSEEIRQRLYGAAFGIAAETLAGLRKDFTCRTEAIFKPRGKGQVLPVLASELAEARLNIQNAQSDAAAYLACREKVRILRGEAEKAKKQLETIRAVETLRTRASTLDREIATLRTRMEAPIPDGELSAHAGTIRELAAAAPLEAELRRRRTELEGRLKKLPEFPENPIFPAGTPDAEVRGNVFAAFEALRIAEESDRTHLLLTDAEFERKKCLRRRLFWADLSAGGFLTCATILIGIFQGASALAPWIVVTVAIWICAILFYFLPQKRPQGGAEQAPEARARLQAIWRSLQVPESWTQEEFRRALELSDARDAAARERAVIGAELARLAGDCEKFERLRASLPPDAPAPAELERRLRMVEQAAALRRDLNGRLKLLADERAGILLPENVGELPSSEVSAQAWEDANSAAVRAEEELRRFAEEPDPAAEQTHAAVLETRLKKAAEEYLRGKLALHLLDGAVERYERENQSTILQHASRIFRDFTCGAYTQIFQFAESPELVLFHASGLRRKVDELSRGTREQLFLALRCALIAATEEKASAMPVILDDVLVDFDRQRRAAALEGLRRFAEKRQVVLFCCS